MAQAYQNLIPNHPRFSLATFPSPLHRVERFEAALRDVGCAAVPRIYLKRDDLLSLGLGGNKIRNLEFLIGRALADGATDVITEGRQQSNHCRLTAAACAKAGLAAHIVLNGTKPATRRGNLLLDVLFGADVVFVGSDDRKARADHVRQLEDTLRSDGKTTFTIRVGGSDMLGALGHVLLAAELRDQMDALDEDQFTTVLATATGGTQAGLLSGLCKIRRPPDVVGLAVAKSDVELRHDVAELAAEIGAEIGASVPAEAVVVDERALGGGYGVTSGAGTEAIAALARSEGIVADPVYTGKGLAGLISLIRERRWSDSQVVVFVHTGGSPALFVS